nr:hypothetical protein GCM10020093_004300 [Planobispora longispora]
MSRQFTLRSGLLHAEITQRAAALRVLRHDGRDLVASWPADGPIPCYSGTLLAPWPNRVGGARYRFGGESFDLPVNEEDLGNALHGLVADVAWEAVEWRPPTTSTVSYGWRTRSPPPPATRSRWPCRRPTPSPPRG